MKKVAILPLLVMAILTFAFFACQKTTDETNQTVKNIQLKSGEWGLHKVWNGVDDCPPPAVNCYDDIIVKPPNNYVTDLNNKVDSGRISTFFADGGDWQYLFPDLGTGSINQAYLHKLSSGHYSITKVTSSNRIFYLAGETGTFNPSNPEFVLVISTSN